MKMKADYKPSEVAGTVPPDNHLLAPVVELRGGTTVKIAVEVKRHCDVE